jgi:hypothetical protein
MGPFSEAQEENLDLLRDALLKLHDVRQAAQALYGFLERSGERLGTRTLQRLREGTRRAAEDYCRELLALWEAIDEDYVT